MDSYPSALRSFVVVVEDGEIINARRVFVVSACRCGRMMNVGFIDDNECSVPGVHKGVRATGTAIEQWYLRRVSHVISSFVDAEQCSCSSAILKEVQSVLVLVDVHVRRHHAGLGIGSVPLLVAGFWLQDRCIVQSRPPLFVVLLFSIE